MGDIPTTVGDLRPGRSVYYLINNRLCTPHLDNNCNRMKDPDPEDINEKPASVLFYDERLCRVCRDTYANADEPHPNAVRDISHEQHELVES